MVWSPFSDTPQDHDQNFCSLSRFDLRQTTDNQIQEIAAAGFHVMPMRAITETISGSVAAGERPGFRKLQEKLEAGDVLIFASCRRNSKPAMY